MSKITEPKIPLIPIKIPRLSCPAPGYEFIDSSISGYDPSEFSSAQLLNGHGTFNSTQANKFFRHTIKWTPKHKCCQVLKARLVVKMKSLQSGQSSTSPNSGNDSISIVKNGGISILSQKIYTAFSFPAGTTVTKSFSLVGNQLDWLNSNHKLSIFVQDDTAVLSIKLKLWVCCLSIKRQEKE